MSFADQLKTERKRLGLTQAGAASSLEIGLRTYAVWERDDDPKRKPHVLAQEGALARLRKVKTPRNAAP
jgi:DNA-binding XRE family transcriptional regulator